MARIVLLWIIGILYPIIGMMVVTVLVREDAKVGKSEAYSNFKIFGFAAIWPIVLVCAGCELLFSKWKYAGMYLVRFFDRHMPGKNSTLLLQTVGAISNQKNPRPKQAGAPSTVDPTVLSGKL